MATLLQHSCEMILRELKSKTYRYQHVRKQQVELIFELKELPSKHTPDIDQLHLVATDTKTGTFIYLAEIKPGATAEWVVEDSQFTDTKKFGELCIELMESQNPTTPYHAGQLLKDIATREFFKIHGTFTY